MEEKVDIRKKLEGVILSITDKLSIFPCRMGRPKEEYPDFYWWRFQLGRGENKYRSNILYLPVKGKTYVQVAENLYRALTGEKKDFFDLSNRIRKDLHKTIVSDKSYETLRDPRHWSEK